MWRRYDLVTAGVASICNRPRVASHHIHDAAQVTLVQVSSLLALPLIATVCVNTHLLNAEIVSASDPIELSNCGMVNSSVGYYHRRDEYHAMVESMADDVVPSLAGCSRQSHFWSRR